MGAPPPGAPGADADAHSCRHADEATLLEGRIGRVEILF